jgi:acyl-CoA thioesterase
MMDASEIPATALPAGDALARRVGEAMYARDAAAKAMGIAVGEVREGAAVLTMTVRPDMLNGHGIAHGGLVFALADTAFAYACNSRNEPTVALQCSISFARATRSGEVLTARAQERTRSKRTSTYDVTVCGQDGEIVALFRGTAYRRDGTYL